MTKILNLDEQETFQANSVSFLPQYSALTTEFVRRFFDWSRVAQIEKQKIKIVILYDPVTDKIEFSFSKANDNNLNCQ